MTDICYPKDLLSVEQAKSAIIAGITSITDVESVSLSEALGRVLAETIHAPIDIPPHRNAAMDGYAFASPDLHQATTTTLAIAGCSWAGKPFTGNVEPGQCVRIFTGAVVPAFADSVIAQEQTERQGEYVTLPSSAATLKNIRAAGSDVARGEVLVVAGKSLGATDLGLIAAAGISRVTVKRRVRVGFFSTGDELVALDQALQPGQIYDSNRYLLDGLLRHPNHDCHDLGVIADDAEGLTQTLSAASRRFDLLISTGGASVGDADFVKQALERCGAVNFWKLAIKPGKPLAFGRIGSCWYFGLPGNPVAVSVTYRQFVTPALQRLGGTAIEHPLRIWARCEQHLRKTPGRQEYQRGLLRQSDDGTFSVSLAGAQESHQQKSASLANAYIVLDADCAGIEAGSQVCVEPFSTLIERM